MLLFQEGGPPNKITNFYLRLAKRTRSNSALALFQSAVLALFQSAVLTHQSAIGKCVVFSRYTQSRRSMLPKHGSCSHRTLTYQAGADQFRPWSSFKESCTIPRSEPVWLHSIRPRERTRFIMLILLTTAAEADYVFPPDCEILMHGSRRTRTCYVSY